VPEHELIQALQEYWVREDQLHHFQFIKGFKLVQGHKFGNRKSLFGNSMMIAFEGLAML